MSKETRSRPGPGLTADYAGCVGNHIGGKYNPRANGTVITSKSWGEPGNLWDSEVTFATIPDGLSNTFLSGRNMFLSPNSPGLKQIARSTAEIISSALHELLAQASRLSPTPRWETKSVIRAATPGSFVLAAFTQER